MSKIVKSTIIVSTFSVLGIGLNFCTNIVIAAKFGAGYNMDSHLAAIAFPFYIVTILSGALSITFIPVFAEYKAKDIHTAWSIVNDFVNISGLLLVVVCIVGMVMANPAIQQWSCCKF